MVANPDVEWSPGIDRRVGGRGAALAAGRVARSVDPSNPTDRCIPSARRVPDLFSGTGHALFADIWKSIRGPPPTAPTMSRQRTARGLVVGFVSAAAGRPSIRSTDSTRATSCIWRTSTSVIGSARRAGSTCTSVRGHRPQRGTARARIGADAAGASPQRLPFPGGPQPGRPAAPLRLVLRAGLALRSKVAVRAARRALDQESHLTGMNDDRLRPRTPPRPPESTRHLTMHGPMCRP